MCVLISKISSEVLFKKADSLYSYVIIAIHFALVTHQVKLTLSG